ncbi:MAG: hypothetical protein ACRDF0_07455 [Candidatus Limnocylindria bacterium]
MSALARGAAPLAFAALAFTLAVERPAGDPDMWWHLASGRWMVEHRALLREDVFSSTALGEPYSVGEWLGQVGLYLAYAAAGWPGVALLRAVLVAVMAYSLARIARRGGVPGWAALPLAGAALLLSSISWGDRPQLFTLALFAVTLDLLFVAWDGRRRVLIALPPLILLWANLHGAYPLGIAAAALFALAAPLGGRPAGGFAAAALVGALLAALSPGALDLPAAAAHAGAPPRFIVEEMPVDPLSPAGATFAAFVLATLGVALLRPAPPLLAILLPPLLWLALSAQRHLSYFTVASIALLAPALAEVARDRLARLPVLPPRPALALAIALWAGALASATGAPTAPDESVYPAAALAVLRAGEGTLLNEYDWGGYLIWSAPERPVFIDGRLFLFVPGVLDEWRRVVELRPGWQDVLVSRDVHHVLLRPDRALVVALREDGWRELVASDGFVLLERP